MAATAAATTATASTAAAATETVVVVGGGVAGIYAALLLQHIPNVRVVLLEAADALGGRLKQDHTWLPGGTPIDLGGEIVHGSRTSLTQLLQRLDLKYLYAFQMYEKLEANTRPVNEWYYLGRERTLLPVDTADADVRRMWEIFDTLLPDKIASNASLLDHLVQHGLPFRMHTIADSLVAKTWGSTADRVGAKAYAGEEAVAAEKDTGRENYKVVGTYAALLAQLKKRLDPSRVAIRTDCRVSAIAVDGARVTVTAASGERFQGTRAIVAVPIPVLKDNDIAFTPALPPRKVQALDKLIMDPGMKCFVRFKQPFWPSNHVIVVCGDMPFSQYWTTSYAKPEEIHYVTGFVMGDAAGALSKLSHEEVARQLVQQLDIVYGTPACPDPATRAYTGSFRVQDWTKAPFVRGGYSCSAVGATGDERKILAEPIGDRIFFAGEAAHVGGCPGTVHGALDSAIAAVRGIAPAAAGTIGTAPAACPFAGVRTAAAETPRARL